MDIDEILEEMEEILNKGIGLPLAQQRKLIDAERMMELVNDIRLNLPHELKEAKKIEYDCQRILNEAKINAEGVVRKAEDRARQICSQQAVVELAEKKAADILAKATSQSRNLIMAAGRSVANMLNEAETLSNKNVADIKKTKEKIAMILRDTDKQIAENIPTKK